MTALFLALALAATGQQVGGGTAVNAVRVWTAADPSGACSGSQVVINLSGSIFTCTGSTWSRNNPSSQAATPTISPAGGVYNDTVAVTISSVTPGAVIRYTTDGTTPGPTSAQYTSALSLMSSATVKAYASASGYTDSSVAEAVFYNTSMVLSLSLSTPGCYSSGTTVDGTPISITRSGQASYYSAGSITDCATNQFRVTGSGVLLESARTNLYASPSSPAAQTITIGATGTYAVSVLGAGSQTFTASGGLTASSGLPCTATMGFPCIVVVTGTGTLTASAVTGSLIHAQVELGAFPSSPIRNGTRNADTGISFSNPGMTGDTWCIGATVIPHGGRTWATGNSAIFSANGLNTANSAYLTGSYWSIHDATPAQKYFAYGMPAVGSHRIVACTTAGTLTLYEDGTNISQTASGAGTGIWSQAPSTIYVGGQAGLSDGNAYIKNVALCTGSSARTLCSTESADTGAIAAFGDSITVGYGATTAYTVSLTNILGPPWYVHNFAVSGTRTDQIAAVFAAQWPGKFRTAAILAGTNDISQGYDTGNIYNRLTAMYSTVRAGGARLIPITIPPCGGIAWCNSAAKALVQSVNTQIKSYCATNGITCVDYYAAVDDGTGAFSTTACDGGTCDSGDHVHPSTAGQNVLARLVRAALP